MTKVLGTKLSTLWTRINTVLVPRQATVTTSGSYHVVTLQNAVTPTPDALVSFSIPASSGDSGDSNQNAFSNVKVGSSTISATTITDTLSVTAGSNISLSVNSKTLTISAPITATTITEALQYVPLPTTDPIFGQHQLTAEDAGLHPGDFDQLYKFETMQGWIYFNSDFYNETPNGGNGSLYTVSTFVNDDSTEYSVFQIYKDYYNIWWRIGSNADGYFSDWHFCSDIPAAGTIIPSAVGTASVTGNSYAYARANHVHAITSATITAALGYTPYNSTNPNGYTSNTGTVTGVKINNSTKAPSSGVVDLGTVVTSAVTSLNSKTGTVTITAGDNITVSSSSNTITISAVNTTYDVFTGATSSTMGAYGLVPAPASGFNDGVLFGDGNFRKLSMSWTQSGSNVFLNIFKKVDTEDVLILQKSIPKATTSASGIMSATDKTNLDALVAAGPEANVQSDWNQTVTTADDYIKNKPGNATTATDGLMSATDKAKLDNYDASMTVTGTHTEITNHLLLTQTSSTNGYSKIQTANNSNGDLYITLYDQDDIPSYRWYFSYYGNIARQQYDGVGGWGDADYFIPRSQLAARFSTTSVNISPGSVAANSTKFATASVAKTGYTPIGISGYYLNGAASLTVYCMRLDGTSVQYGLRNPGSSASSSTATLAVQVIYVANS